jgi:uncharacterized protein YbjT (DUF2867 family)
MHVKDRQGQGVERMILVTGGSGTVGRKVLHRLPANIRVRAMNQSGTGVPERPGPLFEVVRGDYDFPETVRAAMRGVQAVFVVTSDPMRPWQDETIVRAAESAGVRHLVKLSAAAVEDPGAQDAVTRWQRANEDLVRDSRLEWTLLRPRAFMSNTLGWAPGIRESGVVRAMAGDGPNACIDPRDIARAAVEVLTGRGHAGKAYTLTGPAAISPRQQAAAIGEVLGRTVRFEELEPREALPALLRRYPLPVAQALLDGAERQRAGAKLRVTTDLADLTGQGPARYLDWVRDHSPAFGPAESRVLDDAA